MYDTQKDGPDPNMNHSQDISQVLFNLFDQGAQFADWLTANTHMQQLEDQICSVSHQPLKTLSDLARIGNLFINRLLTLMRTVTYRKTNDVNQIPFPHFRS